MNQKVTAKVKFYINPPHRETKQLIMNNERRKLLEKLIRPIEDIKSQVETILEEDQAAYDNIPENLQNSQNGEKAQNAISAIENAVQSLEESIENINESLE